MAALFAQAGLLGYLLGLGTEPLLIRLLQFVAEDWRIWPSRRTSWNMPGGKNGRSSAASPLLVAAALLRGPPQGNPHSRACARRKPRPRAGPCGLASAI